MMSFLCGRPRAGYSTEGGVSERGAEGEYPLPHPAGHAASDPAQDMTGLSGLHPHVAGSSLSRPVGLLSIPSNSSLYLCLGFPQPMCRTLHLAFLTLTRFAQVQLSCPSKSLWMPSLLSSMSLHHTAWLVSLANLLTVQMFNALV